ncbi:MAG: hypothetical protein KKC68_08255 [Candidatus Thermoplasmatota archaeon]|nr:hypothetical protein [Candidatus Thermoplasmatota archaeon]MBU1941751.1 hypothetical protein [Candidatus Thermoplasmatota archaeon]
MDEEVISINYWKEVHNDISTILKDIRGIVLITHNSIEFTDIIDILNMTRLNHFLSTLYISLTRSYDFMKLALQQKELKEKQMFFIDCVSGFAFPSEDKVDDCLYHKPPSNLQEMKDIISYGIEKANPDMIIIDSLSQFINFSRPTEHELKDLYVFLRTLRGTGLNIVQDTFFLFYDNRMGMMLNLPKMHTDLILKVEVLKEDPMWKD